jgi:GT2 family glycosyltransferase
MAVVIATRDRSEALALTLAALVSARRPERWRIEIRVVDNDPAGADAATAAVIAEAGCRAAETPDGCLRVVALHEARAGVSHARNRALAPDLDAADAYAVIDDDVIVAENYFEMAATLLASKPEAGVIGGRVELHDARDLEATVLMWPSPRRLHLRNDLLSFVLGCNLLIRGETFVRVGAFDPDLGSGTPLKSAEDADFVFRAWRAGFEVLYEPSLRAAHNHGRRDRSTLERLFEGYALGAGGMFCKHVLFARDPQMAGFLARRLWKDIRLGGGRVKRWRHMLAGADAYRRLRRARDRG